MYVDYIYMTIKDEYPDADTVYEDLIVKLVGEFGLKVLKDHNLVKTIGSSDGRSICSICDK